MSLMKRQGINMNLLKNKINNQKRLNNKQISDKEKIKNIVSSFRHGVINQKSNHSKFKTSKNSPERMLFDNSQNLKSKIINGTINGGGNNSKVNNHIILSSAKQNEKNFENLLKRKIIKIQEKKSITQANTNNNSISLSNNTINHTNTSNSLYGYLPQTNYISKIKSKMSLDNSVKQKKYNGNNSQQKRSNSTLEEDEKHNNYYANLKENIYNKYISSSSSKNDSNIKSPFNTLNNKNNTSSKIIIPNHMKNSSLFSSTLSALYKPKNSKQIPKFHFEIKGISRTSYPTKNNSRKHSNDKNIKKINNNLNGKRDHIKVKSNNLYNNSLLGNIKKREISEEKKLKNNGIITNSIKFSKNISREHSKENSKTISKKQSKNNSKDNILINSHRKKNTISDNHNIKEKVVEKIIYSNKKQYPKDFSFEIDKKNKRESHSSNVTVNIKNNNLIPDLKKESKEKELKELKELKEKEIKESKEKELKELKELKEKEIKELKELKELKEKEIKELKENELKEKAKFNINIIDNNIHDNKKPDRDLENEENQNDSLLSYLNSNIDISPNQNNLTTLNESYDSVQSILKENGKFTQYNRDMETISQYIKKYYKKNNKYPTTKMKFYKYGRLLGKGAFGKVNLSLHTLTGRLVAIKSINKTKLINERQKAKIQLETSIMKILSSSNYIVKIYETFQTQKHFCIVMEYICAGDLLSYIRKRSKLTEQIAKFIFKQIILSLQYIHNHNIIHRDIKLDNILIDLNNNIKICDFGVSKKISLNDKMYEQCGTPAYIAPEILKNKGYEGFSVDIWSAGVVLYAMLSGTVPFKGNNLNELHDLIMKGKFNVINDISNDAKHLIKCLLEVDPRKRISVQSILNHPWLVNVDVSNTKNYNLFTNAERVLLAKSNVDYRDINNKDDIIENFDLKNLDTGEETENKNINTKSIILAPFNSSMSEEENKFIINNTKIKNSEDDYNNKELIIKNNVIKFSVKVKELNRNYELNNNGEIDNGVVISPNDSHEKKKENNDISPYNGSYYSKIQSKPFSPFNEMEEGLSSRRENKDDKNNNTINDKALSELCELGYNKKYVIDCINKNDINYATAGYYLLDKFS